MTSLTKKITNALPLIQFSDRNKFAQLYWQNRSGSTAIEYSLIALFIAVAIVAAVRTLGGDISTVFEDISAAFDTMLS